MTAKILAGLLAAVALTGVSIYAATGSVPGSESIAQAISGSAPSGCCHANVAASCVEATECPISIQTPFSPDATSACVGGVTAGASYASASRYGCCAE